MNTSSHLAISAIVHGYSLATLEDTPRRALEFLRGISSTPAIRVRLKQVGYTLDVHEEGQLLLNRVLSLKEGRQPFGTVNSASHKAATDQLEAWFKTVYRRIKVGATRYFPEAASELFANLEISAEMDASAIAKILTDRMEEQKLPKGMLKLFAERGFGPTEIHDVKKVVAIAQAPAPEQEEMSAEASAELVTKQKEDRLQMLAELRAWYDDWSEVARTVLGRRDWAIRVGLAHRKPRSGSTPASPVVVEPVVAPIKAA